jgi:hypothetical protein
MLSCRERIKTCAPLVLDCLAFYSFAVSKSLDAGRKLRHQVGLVTALTAHLNTAAMPSRCGALGHREAASSEDLHIEHRLPFA